MSGKMTSSKSLLLRAWRERWSEMQWSINIKQIIDPNNSEEVQQLADMMLQQALLGSTPNMLILSYLRYTVSSKTINLVSALQSMCRYSEISKPYCIKSLLDIMELFVTNISCRGTSEDCLALARSCLAVQLWLLEALVKFMQKLNDGKQVAEYCTLVKRVCNVIEKLLEREENRALLFIARHDDPALCKQVEQAEVAVKECKMTQMTQPDLMTSVVEVFQKLPNVLEFWMEPRANLDVSHQPINISINTVTGIEAVLNPTSDMATLIEQLLVIERSQGLKRSALYCELFRTCMMGMQDAAGGTDELKWASFTFLKLPNLLQQLVQRSPNLGKKSDVTGSEVIGSDSEVAKADLELGLKSLLNLVPLLDATDVRCHCDCLGFLLHELCKPGLITEDTLRALMSKRQSESNRQNPTEQPSQQPSAGLILRAEPTLYSILKTLDTDYSKNQEPLKGVLSQMMSGKSLELILAAAAARGKVEMFAMKIVKFNELSKHAVGEGNNAAQTRATIFDISFLMLCHISQLYGLQIVTSCTEGANSFFSQWATRSLPEDGHYKSLDLMLPADNNRVEVLLGQVNPGGELRMSLTRWHEVCQNIPYVIQEVLYAWEHGTLQKENVQVIIESLKTRMCCLPVIVAAWLCSFIMISDSAAREKPLQVLQWLVSSPSSESTTKSNLMLAIIRRMIQDVLPQPPSGIPNRPTFYTLPPRTPIGKVLIGKFTDIFQRGCIDIQSIHQMEHLLNIGGTKWFCENLVKEILNYDRVEDINKAVSLTYALFHLEIDALTLDLVYHVLPSMLQLSEARIASLMDPKGRALARLVVMCLCVCHKIRSLTLKEGSPSKRGKKRSRTEFELEDPAENTESRALKLRRLSSACEELLPPNFGSEAFTMSTVVSPKEELELNFDTTDTLNKSLVNLFRLFNAILSQPVVSPRTGFVSSFIEETIKSGTHTARFILQFMPPTMVSQLVKCLNHEYNTQFLLHMCDLSTLSGRRIAAKVVCQHARAQQFHQS